MRPLALARLGALAAASFVLAGCQHGAYYAITPLYPAEPVGGTLSASAAGGVGDVSASASARNRLEVLHDRLDGHWFERRIYGAGSGTSPDALELMYCPLVSNGPTVCRTTTIWTKGATNLLEGDVAAAAAH
jgi:hypothetical protein